MVERGFSGEELIEQHAQRIDVRARVDIELIELGLLGAHVFDRTHNLAKLSEHRFFGQVLANGFGNAEIDDLGNGAVVVVCHEDVAGPQIAVDDALLIVSPAK